MNTGFKLRQAMQARRARELAHSSVDPFGFCPECRSVLAAHITHDDGVITVRFQCRYPHPGAVYTFADDEFETDDGFGSSLTPEVEL